MSEFLAVIFLIGVGIWLFVNIKNEIQGKKVIKKYRENTKDMYKKINK